MDENAKKDSAFFKYAKYASVLLGIGLVMVIITSMLDRNRNIARYNVEKHIKTVMTIDRNCNDCHLGASFVNLFNHEAVKGNDNVAIFVMRKVNIKMW